MYRNELTSYHRMPSEEIVKMRSSNGEEGSTRNQYLAAILMNLTQFAYGCALGWISPMTLVLQSPESPSGSPIGDETMSWMTASLPLGCLVATPFYGYLADARGRKIAALAVSVPSVISWVLKLCSAAPWCLIVARTLAGVSSGGSLVVTPMYVTEISDDSVRGSLGTLLMFINTSGILAGYICGGLLSYTLSVALFLIPPVLHILAFLKMPETPPYLVKIGKQHAAAESMGWFKSLSPDDKIVQHEVQKLVEKNEEVKNLPKISIQSILRDRASRRGLVIVFLLLTVQGWNGGFAVTTYVSTIFHAAFGGNGASEDASSFVRIILSNVGSSVIVGLLMMLGGFVGVMLVERSGRKALLISSNICGAICMVTLGTWFYLTGIGVNTPSWLPVTALSLFVFGNIAGVGPVPLVIMAEVFSFQIRSTLSVLVLSWVWISAFVQLKVFTPLVNLLGIHVLMWIYTGVSVFGAIYSMFGVPETKGRSLDDIADELSGNSTTKQQDIIASRT